MAEETNFDKVAAPGGFRAGSADLIESELEQLDGITPGTVTASKAVVVDSNKDIGDFRNLDAVNVDAGASGAAGSVDVFPSTASKGKTSFTADDNTGNTTTNIKTAEQAGARTYTVPDAGANASFLMTEGDQTLAEGKDIAVGTATGSKIGTAANQKLGFFGATPVVQGTTYTQTYSTTDKTHANMTSADLATTAATQSSPWGFASQAQAENIATQVNLLRADLIDLKQFVNALVDDLQALGFIA